MKQRTGKAEGAGAAVPLFGGVFGGRGEFTPDVNHADSAMNAGKDLRTDLQSKISRRQTDHHSNSRHLPTQHVRMGTFHCLDNWPKSVVH